MTTRSSVTVAQLSAMKDRGERISCLTVYDYSFAHILEQAGVDILLVGDSLGMVIQGHETTLPVSMADVLYHTQCVSRGCNDALVVADMPFGSYQGSPQSAFENAVRLVGEGGAHMVKIEGGTAMAETVTFLVDRGIPVCGHIGLTPQSVNQLGGFRVQGREESAAEALRRDARNLAEAGASLLIIEAIPAQLAKSITDSVSIPTVGIGAGPDTDGQVLVLYDVLGLFPRKSPKFSKDFLEGKGSVLEAVKVFVEDVRARRFPGPEHSF
tara:strand:+ start:656 stop:1462 length:807 start_codon:yes stop_codon:yes gene_type:complete